MNRTLLLAIALLLPSFATLAQEEQSVHEITQVEGNLYRYANQSHVSVFYLWDEGVVVTDPISAQDAAWLKNQIAAMTDKPITHLIYSHSHGDHASGGQAFGEVPNVIAHANAPDAIDGVQITSRFDDSLTLELGDARVELTYLGAPGHGDELIAMVFRPENVAFSVDSASVTRLPYGDIGGGHYVEGLTEQIKLVESLDFDTFVGGHGPVGDKQNVVDHRVYLETLEAAVRQGLQAGKSVEQLKAEITLDDYSDWLGFDAWRELNIEGMAAYLRDSGVAE